MDVKDTKLIVAGCRWFEDWDLIVGELNQHIAENNLKVSEIISGGANGVDSLAELYAIRNKINFRLFRADWKKHGKKAGPIRNTHMSYYGDFLVAFWDQKSRGTRHMIQCMKQLDKPVVIVDIKR